MSRKTLESITEERLVPVVYTSAKPIKAKEKKRYFVQLDCDGFYSVTEKLSKTACRVAILMLRDMNHFTNIFSGTYEEVEEELQLTQRPVREAMAELQQVDFIRKYRNGRYMVNPCIALGCSEEYIPKLKDEYHSLQAGVSKKKRSDTNVDR